ncbi:MAG: head GIN domain-containing protein [Flavobacteriaceae bacterium]
MKSIHILVSTLFLAFSIPMSAQWGSKIKGNGNVVTENRDVAAYDEVHVNGNIDVVLVDGKEGKITLKAEENLLEHIEVSVKNDALKIKSKDRTELRPSKGKNILITVPVQDVHKLALNGSGEIEGTFPLKAKSIKLQVNGSGDMDVDLKATDVKAVVNGSGDIKVSGKADYFEAIVTGSGDIDGDELVVNICEGKVVGSGDIKFHAEQKLDAKIVGSGDIEVNKSVIEIEKKIIGSGDVTKK